MAAEAILGVQAESAGSRFDWRAASRGGDAGVTGVSVLVLHGLGRRAL